MSTTISQVAGMKFQGNASADKVTTVAEARQGKSADGGTAPKGTTPVVVERGDTLSQIMAKYGLDWNNPADREQFLRDNPQFADLAGGRNPNLIWPGEVVYVRTEGAKESGGDGESGSGSTREAAAKQTETAAKNLEQAEKAKARYMSEPGSAKGERGDYEADVESAKQKLLDAIRKEIGAGLTDYLAKHPDASAADISKEATRLQHEIQGRSTTGTSLDDRAIGDATQQAINDVSARQHGIDLGKVDAGTPIKDGPYDKTHGPFEPNTSVKIKDGTYVKTDENGWPDRDVDNDGRPDPETRNAASKATDEAAKELVDLKNDKQPGGGVKINRSEEHATLTTKVGNAIQREIELGLREYIAAHGDTPLTQQQIQAEAKRLSNQILGRPGISDAVSESSVQFRMEQAIAAVTQGK